MGHENDLAAKLRGFGPVGLAAMVLIILAAIFIEVVPALMVLLWARLARLPWSALGFARPRSWVATVTGGLIAGLLLKLVLKALVLPLLGVPPINPTFHYIAGNMGALARMIIAVVLIAGFGEEILYRGYLFERLRRLLGNGPVATAAIVVSTTTLFALAHLASQGIPGAENAALSGLAFALMFVRTGSIWLSIVTHASFDVAAILIIYFEAEEAVARAVWG